MTKKEKLKAEKLEQEKLEAEKLEQETEFFTVHTAFSGCVNNHYFRDIKKDEKLELTIDEAKTFKAYITEAD